MAECCLLTSYKGNKYFKNVYLKKWPINILKNVYLKKSIFKKMFVAFECMSISEWQQMDYYSFHKLPQSTFLE